MALPLTIVGIGEALLIETAEGPLPGGLAMEVALEAVRGGNTGVAVSRLGQDEVASELIRQIDEAKVATRHLQSDPDLPTGRASGAGKARRLPSRAAYDNLQWDHDLVDLAARTDIAICGLHAARWGQSRSVIQQFLDECRDALRLVELVDAGGATPDRALLRSMLATADAALVDGAAAALLLPGISEGDAADSARRLLRQHGLQLVVWRRDDDDGRVRLTASDAEGSRELDPVDADQLTATIVGVLVERRLSG